MWIYIVSFYVEASLEVRKRRLPYIIVSLTILVLSSASNVMWAVQAYQIIFEMSPAVVNSELAEAILSRNDTLEKPASLLADTALRVANALLVSFLH